MVLYNVVLFCHFALSNLRWDPTLKALKGLEKLLSKRLYRERFLATCVTNESHEKILASFSAKLGSLRWNAVTEFCEAVAKM